MAAFEHGAALCRLPQIEQTCGAVLFERVFKARMFVHGRHGNAHVTARAVRVVFALANTTDAALVAVENLFFRRRIVCVANGARVRGKLDAALRARVGRLLHVAARNAFEMRHVEAILIHLRMTQATWHKLATLTALEQTAALIMRTVHHRITHMSLFLLCCRL